LLLIAGDDAPAAGEVDPLARGADLVLVRGRGGPPRVESWYRATQARTHQWVDEGASFDAGVGVAGRRALGRSLGIVLSGGGAGGLAHVGVLDELHRSGVSFDRFGGTSIGAFVGALAAQHRDPDEIADVCRRELVDGQPLRGDFTIPRYALTRGRRWKALLQRVFGDARVEDLPGDFFSVSADLVSAESVVHRHGPLWQAVGVSMALPGLVPPSSIGDRLLVDGGLLNNFPVDVMADRNEGPIVGVDVMGRRLGAEGGKVAVPAIGETLTRATALGSHERARRSRQLATWVITPELRDIGMLDFRRIGDAVDRGRIAARATLAEHPTLSSGR
jgi:predicted acylesterase/phospholipase RssA